MMVGSPGTPIHYNNHHNHRGLTPRRGQAVINTLALIGGLCVIIVTQFILFPLVFTFLIDDPYRQQQQSKQLESYTSTTTTATQKISKRKRIDFMKSNDGTFNGAPLILKSSATLTTSHVHCVGENYRPDAWKHRSCRFSHLCLDTAAQEFVVFQSLDEQLLSMYMAQRVMMHSSTTLLRRGSNATQAMAIGGINQKWGHEGIDRLKWFPKIHHVNESSSSSSVVYYYYQLPDNVVLVPFHSMNGANPGHLVWDDFLPIYTLLDMFGLIDREPLLMRYRLHDGERGLWASCDLRPEKNEECKHMMNKFMPLMMNRAFKFTTNDDFEFVPKQAGISNLVCAKAGVAGMGPLTDHGVFKSHGWEEEDYLMVHNHGRGGQLYKFRNYMLENMGISTRERRRMPPHRIVFSQKSSDIKVRNLDFDRQIALVKEAFPDENVESYVFKDMSVEEQLRIASDTSIYVTLCGGGAVTAMFLPRGATVIAYYSDDGGTYNGNLNGKPALLDWDLFNSMSHLRVHWLPRNSMQRHLDEMSLVLLIKHEIAIMNGLVFD